jgi:putative endonuclease
MAGQVPRETFDLPEGVRGVECPEPVEGLCWVYILFCRNESLYVGQTHDVERRLRRHTQGTGTRHTALLKDFVLIFVEGPMEPSAAILRERQLKKWSRAKKLALIRGDKAELRRLSCSKD